MPSSLTAQQSALPMSKRRAGSRQKVAAAAGAPAEAKARSGLVQFLGSTSSRSKVIRAWAPSARPSNAITTSAKSPPAACSSRPPVARSEQFLRPAQHQPPRCQGGLGAQPVTRAQSQKTAKAQIRDAGTSIALASRYWLTPRAAKTPHQAVHQG
jgi:hypothetical protein